MKLLRLLITSILLFIVWSAPVDDANIAVPKTDNVKTVGASISRTIPSSNEMATASSKNGIVRYEVTETENGRKFVFELDDGQYREEEIIILNKDTDEEELLVYGRYKFVGTDGQIYDYDYKSDRDGYFVSVHEELPPVQHIDPGVLKSLIG